MKPVLMNKYISIPDTCVQNFDVVANLLSFKIKDKTTTLLTKKTIKRPFMTAIFEQRHRNGQLI